MGSPSSSIAKDRSACVVQADVFIMLITFFDSLKVPYEGIYLAIFGT